MKRKTQFTDAEREEAYQSMKSDLESGDCVFLQSDGFRETIRFCGKLLGSVGDGQDFPDERAALKAACQQMERQGYWPNIYSVNDHGNVSLLDRKGREIMSWV
jgi:hypothetical protein